VKSAGVSGNDEVSGFQEGKGGAKTLLVTLPEREGDEGFSQGIFARSQVDEDSVTQILESSGEGLEAFEGPTFKCSECAASRGQDKERREGGLGSRFPEQGIQKGFGLLSVFISWGQCLEFSFGQALARRFDYEKQPFLSPVDALFGKGHPFLIKTPSSFSCTRRGKANLAMGSCQPGVEAAFEVSMKIQKAIVAFPPKASGVAQQQPERIRPEPGTAEAVTQGFTRIDDESADPWITL
jgi:hypothetical protein